ncbi:cytochrome P450 [Streptomyces sp. NPDC087851]|uniref:cytochrome P450 n=1 Tax=Streptomyces sp. NPDC087851 TaxID=3365810 RepID=UPI00382D96B4
MSTALRFGQGPLHDIDLSNPVVHAERDLRPVWRLLRERTPVAWHPPTRGGPGFWVVTPYRLAIEVFGATDRFTSGRGNNIATLLHGGDPAGGRMLAVSDGPRHKQLRRELGRGFTAGALAPYERRIAANIDGLVRDAVARGDSDFAREVARPVPMAVVCDLLRVPEADRPALYEDASAALASEAPVAADLDTRLARNQILLYFAKLVRSYRKQEDDLLGLLVRLTETAVELSEDELLYNCYSVLLGGEETTRFAMSASVQTLAQWPGEWRRLVRGEVTVASAVEELLRWTTVSMHSGRTTLHDTELGGVPIARDDILTVWNSAANFDAEQFPHPDRLDLGREPNRHLSFLHGPHICPGARLARLELTALLRALLDHADHWELTGEPTPVYSTFMKGLSGLPVRFTPRRGARTRAVSAASSTPTKPSTSPMSPTEGAR